MAGTRAGGLKAAKVVKEKYGDSFYSHIGQMGGKVCCVKGFAAMPLGKVRAAGRKGGLRGRRGAAHE
jgi:hypothetical protein